MEFQHLRALLLVAETGSVTEAARRLLLTQPAVTRQLRALEDELGGVLFDRTTKPLLPTPLGQAALTYARRIVQISDDLRALVRSHSGIPTGELRLGVVHACAHYVIPPLVQAMRHQYPGVYLRLTSSWSAALTREVEEGVLDAAIVLTAPGSAVPPGLEGRCVGTEPLTLLASAQTGLQGTVAVEKLRGHVWVLSREGCGYRAVLKRTLEAAEIPFIVAVEVLDIALQLQLIADGVGAGIMAQRALPPLLEERGVHPFRLADMPAALEVWVFHRRHGPLLPVVMPLIHGTVAALVREAVPVPQEWEPGQTRCLTLEERSRYAAPFSH
jgi:DNA-binding transcriptional LysR family regulator